jgi:hypothetical protein
MKIHKRIIGIVLSLLFLLNGLPVPVMDLDMSPSVFAEGVLPGVAIRFDDFSDTEGLQLNGESIIYNNAIRFENDGLEGKSVFTKEKIALDENLSFSTAFSFRNISPATAEDGTRGGFSFTLQPIDNTKTATGFYDESVSPSLCIAFVFNYTDSGEIIAKVARASAADRCFLGYVMYANGTFDCAFDGREIGDAREPISDLYHVWIGYDGENKRLEMIFEAPSGEYNHYYADIDLSEMLTETEVYAGFLGSLDSAGNACEITSWQFANDLNIWDEAAVAADEWYLAYDMTRFDYGPLDYFSLLDSGEFGSTFIWHSDNPDVFSDDGTVNHPLPGEPDARVGLTAYIVKGAFMRTRSFEIYVSPSGMEIVKADYDWLTDQVIRNENTSLDRVVSDLYLPVEGYYKSSISWESSDPSVIDTDGRVTRPGYSDTDKLVVLTAYFFRNGFTDIKDFYVTVRAKGMTDEERVEEDELWLTEARLLSGTGNDSLDRVTENINLPEAGLYGSVISWESSDPSVIDTKGNVTRPSLAAGDRQVLLTALIQSNDIKTTKTFTARVKVRDEDILSADDLWLTEELVLNGNLGPDHVVTDLYMPEKEPNGSTILWTSFSENTVSLTGTVTRPLQGEGNREVVLIAVLESGKETPISKTFRFLVRAVGLSDAEILNADYAWLTENVIRGGNEGLGKVVSNLNLPSYGLSGSRIVWTSDDTDTIYLFGTVTRPAFSKGDKAVTLTATLSVDYEEPITKTFLVTVKAKDQTHEEKTEADAEWLKPSVILGRNASLDQVTENLALPVTGADGSVISWESSDSSVIDTWGKVTRPVLPKADKTVVLTAVLTSGDAIATVTFTVTVKARPKTDQEKLTEDWTVLTEDLILNENTDRDHITKDLFLPTEGANGSSIVWESSEPEFVNEEGGVKRPTYTQKDKAVILTATVTCGDEDPLVKQFILVVKALEQTQEEKDMETVLADYEWLLGKEKDILNQNFSLNTVTGDLYLPITGEKGCEILWYSDNEDMISNEGKVTRPLWTEGDKEVVLTAVIRKGTASKEKTYTVKVLKRPFTDRELVEMDYNRLTEEIIKNGNPSLDHVTNSLYFPSQGPDRSGHPRSRIYWKSSHHGFVALDGTVQRPKFYAPQDPVITLTATVTYGTVSMTKTFVVTVMREEYNDKDAIEEAVKWLSGYRTLGDNPSAYAVSKDLSWPVSGPHDTVITWHSDRTDLITDEGKVTYAPYESGNQEVSVTATVTKGSESAVLNFQYVVLRYPDNGPPYAVYSVPKNGTEIPWDTYSITVVYSEGIRLATDHGIICLQGSAEVPIHVGTYDERLVIRPVSVFPAGDIRIVIPQGAVIDSIGLKAQAYELNFTVGERPKKDVTVAYAYPQNGQRDVDPLLRTLTIRFNSDDLEKGENFESKVSLTCENRSIPITYTLTGDTVTISLSDYAILRSEKVHRLTVSEGAVKNGFGNQNKKITVEFVTKDVTMPNIVPEIIGIYPSDGQAGVSVKPSIEVVYEKQPDTEGFVFTLTDSTGKEVPLYTPYELDTGIYTKLIFIPKETLKPITEYVFSGPGILLGKSSTERFGIRFTVGSGPRVVRTTPAAGDFNAPVHGIVEIQFDEPVTAAERFEDIRFLDFADDPVEFTVEVKGNKAILRTEEELGLQLPYSVVIPDGAFRNANGAPNTGHKITFYTSLDRLPFDPEPSYLDIPDTGITGKSVKLSSDTVNMKAWINYARMMDYGGFIHEWYVDGEYLGSGQIKYRTFSSPGEHEITYVVKDKYGFTYSTSKTIEIEDLQGVQLRLKDSGAPWRLDLTEENASSQELKFELLLEKNNLFIYGERIRVRLYRDGVLCPLSGYGDGSISITADYDDTVYTYVFRPEYGDDSTFEAVFTYEGPDGPQEVRQSFLVTSKEPSVTDVFRFRLYNSYIGEYYEEPNYVYITMNGKQMKADKETYTYGDSTFFVYVVRETLKTNAYYEVKIDKWHWNKNYAPFYLGKDTDIPSVFTGMPYHPGLGVRIVGIDYNTTESDLDEYYINMYFKGLPTKLIFNVASDWGGYDPGYYEIALVEWGDKETLSESDFRVIQIHTHDSTREVQKITVQPGLQMVTGNEQYWIRMVSPEGEKSRWEVCPGVSMVPVPSALGKKIKISIVDRQYAVEWPTVFDGPVGDVIKAFDDIPLLEGGYFGLGGGMPSFEGYPYYSGGINLNFETRFGYVSSTKIKTDTKIKKVKKITVVGYEFQIELEGGMFIKYEWDTEKWNIEHLYIEFDTSFVKKWNKGFDLFVAEITAGVYVGAGVYGYIELRDENGQYVYKGLVRLYPNAGFTVDGKFGPYKVKGNLHAVLPAEFHFPTGYIGVDFTVNAKITGKTLLWSGTIYEKNLYSVHWDNGKAKSVLNMAMNTAEEKALYNNTEFTLLPRDYLERQSRWLGADDGSSVMKAALFGSAAKENPAVSSLMENIYPEAELAFAENEDKRYLVWVDDNPVRDALNRTQLRLSVQKDGVWSEPVFAFDDGSADFSPVMAATEDGVLMAWHNIAYGISEAEGLEEMLKASEIAVTQDVYRAGGDIPAFVNLTDDEKLDHSPMLVSDGRKALLVWTKSEDASLDTEEKAPEDRLYFAVWSNGVWSEAQALDDEYGTILDTHLVMAGEEALLLYTSDLDHDYATASDREIYAVVFDGEARSEKIRLTRNDVSDYAAKAVFSEGEWFITWLSEGRLYYRIGLDGEPVEASRQDLIQGDYQLTVKEDERPLIALVYTQGGEDLALNLYVSFYDWNRRLWSDKKALATSDAYTNAFRTVFSKDGRLYVVFTESEVITEAKLRTVDGKEEWIDEKNISDKTDLRLAEYTPFHDVALSKEEGMLLSVPYPLAKTNTVVYVTVQNEGDFAEYVTVSLYDGDPEKGGAKLSETAPYLLPAHTAREAEIEWPVGAEQKTEYRLYAVVRTIDGAEETDFDNNGIIMDIAASDIAITYVSCENPAADDYLIEVTVANLGSTVLDGARVWLEDEFGGIIGEPAAIKTLEVGEKSILTYMIQGRGFSSLKAVASLPEDWKEEDTDNNIREFTLEPAEIMLKSMNIVPGEEQVDTKSSVILTFNRSIEKGSGFDNILLLDDTFNAVDIECTIDNNILTVKPKQELNYGARYRLTIPADAIGDAYGRALRQPIRIEFTTMTKNPEIISAYPAYRMEQVATNAKIRLRYNQEIVKGHDFSAILLTELVDDEDGKTVSIRAFTEGDMLTIQPVGSLSKNTPYRLEIPRGAVENDQGDTQKEDFYLVFMTGESEQEPEDEEEQEEEEEESVTYPPSYYGRITVGGTTRIVEIRITNGKAVVEPKDLADDQKVEITIPPIPGVRSYELNIPVEALSGTGNGSVTLNTPYGSLTIPSGMLSHMKNTDGKTVTISISQGDPATLPDGVKAAVGNRPILTLSLSIDGVPVDWNNPDAPVEVSIPYVLTAEEEKNPESITVWYIDEKGNIEIIINGSYDSVTGTVCFITTHFSRFAVAFNPVSIKDVQDTVWYGPAVRFIAARKITDGIGNGYFGPSGVLTRAQGLTLIMRAFGIEPDADSEDNFKDAGDTWYTGYLAAAKRLGIAQGTGNNLFAPEKAITRQEMFTLLYHALNRIGRLPNEQEKPDRKLSDFTDADQIDAWANKAMTLFVETGIVNGYEDFLLMPKKTMTRAEMAQVLYRLMIG